MTHGVNQRKTRIKQIYHHGTHGTETTPTTKTSTITITPGQITIKKIVSIISTKVIKTTSIKIIIITEGISVTIIEIIIVIKRIIIVLMYQIGEVIIIRIVRINLVVKEKRMKKDGRMNWIKIMEKLILNKKKKKELSISKIMKDSVDMKQKMIKIMNKVVISSL